MRIVGLWGIVFALILGSLLGILLYSRISTDDYWAVFSAYENLAVSDLYLASPANHHIKRLTNTPTLAESFLISTPSGTELVVLEVDPNFQQTLYRTRINATQHKNLIQPQGGRYWINHFYSWIPTHQWLLLVADGWHIMLIDQTGRLKILTERSLCTNTPQEIIQENKPRWSPDGKWIYFNALYCNYDFALERRRPDGSERQIIAKLGFDVWWTTAGDWIVFYHQTDTHPVIYRARPDGSVAQQLTQGNYEIVAVTDWIYLRNEVELFRMQLDGSHFEKLTDIAKFPFDLFFTQNWVYFDKQVDGEYETYRLNLSTLVSENLTTSFGVANLLSVSPDDRWIYLETYDLSKGGTNTYVVSTLNGLSHKLDFIIDMDAKILWISSPNLPWHAERLAVGAFILGVTGFFIRWRVAK